MSEQEGIEGPQSEQDKRERKEGKTFQGRKKKRNGRFGDLTSNYGGIALPTYVPKSLVS